MVKKAITALCNRIKRINVAKSISQLTAIITLGGSLYALYGVASCVNYFEMVRFVVMFILCLIMCWITNKE